MSTETPMPAGKVAVYHVSTGQRLVRWPIDARDMVNTGEYAHTAPLDAPAFVAVAASPTLPTVEALPADMADMTKAQIVAWSTVHLALPLDADKMTKSQILTAIINQHTRQTHALDGAA